MGVVSRPNVNAINRAVNLFVMFMPTFALWFSIAYHIYPTRKCLLHSSSLGRTCLLTLLNFQQLKDVTTVHHHFNF